MTAKQVGIGVLVIAGFVAAGLILHTGKRAPFPQDKIRQMQFPVGLAQSVGAADGSMCHSRATKSGPLDERHLFKPHDWKHATEVEKEAWVIAENLDDDADGTLSCVRPDGTEFLHRSYAGGNKICQDPSGCSDGGACVSWACPAEIRQNGTCANNGPDCIITYKCCGSGCVASC